VYATVLAVASSAEYVIQFETSMQSFCFFYIGQVMGVAEGSTSLGKLAERPLRCTVVC